MTGGECRIGPNVFWGKVELNDGRQAFSCIVPVRLRIGGAMVASAGGAGAA